MATAKVKPHGKSRSSPNDLSALAGRKQSLFDESESGSEDDDGEDGGAMLEGLTKLEVNKEYARVFNYNKKREEMHKLEEKYKGEKKTGDGGEEEDDEDDSSDDGTEDEDGFLATEDLDAEISATLRAIKNKDPSIYDNSKTFYKDFDGTEQNGTAPRENKKKDKPVYLHDYHRERILKGDIGADEDVDEQQPPKAYLQEQEEAKKALMAEINAANSDDRNDDDDDGFITRKDGTKLGTKTTSARGSNGVHPSRAGKIEPSKLDMSKADQDPEFFLSNFMTSRAWVPEEGSRWAAFESDDGEDDNQAMAEEFENAYNMRFEDPEMSNEVLKTYSRDVVAARSVRRAEPTGRAKAREAERERHEAEKQERQEERSRLKKLKVEEAEDKLRKIKRAAGMSGKALRDEDWVKFLEDAWDDDKWEEQMNERFGDQYYAENDETGDDSDGEEEKGHDTKGKKKRKPKKPEWDDDIDITDLVPDFEDGLAKPNITLTDSEGEQNGSNEEDEDDDGRPAKKRKTSQDHKKDRANARRAARQERAKIEALVDAQMELDNPAVLSKTGDTAAAASSSSSPLPKSGGAGLFRYRETSPNSFGLTARDILLAPSDAALNEFAGLKRLATFRDEEKKRKDRKSLGKKARLRKWRRDTFGPEFEHSGPTYGFREDGADADGGAELGAANEDAALQADKKKKKRKRSKGKKGAAAAPAAIA